MLPMSLRFNLLFVLFVAGPALADVHEWRFDGWAGPAIDVRMFVPAPLSADTPVVIVMHGWSRDAERYFDDWRVLGEQRKFIVVVPHFSRADFPSSNDYNLGHVFEENQRKMRPQETWTFAAIESLFDEVLERTGGAQSGYTLFGHSAGSQFVHRFLYYMPDARAKRFIAANAGWYTMPDFDTGYPYGLKGASISNKQLRVAFGKDVIIMLGREDIDEADPDLRNTREAKRQGRNRLTRGMTYFSVAKTVADSLGVTLSWRLAVVDLAGHENARMAAAAAQFIE